ncbi:hypothetical protein [Sporolituus thermophilus]|uniref:Uncharacterized protein n=1 Tax=Sporolituus thermophilus DSM 23256 TaxID=1123285 RepID=A0A1G7I9I2_9FIRM|nr:hypothetical protein [Sporolituus thermophilus]SDF09248.1 hypothetical protein SAMN05660235_00410 [Sporolituus thermophilus DSM 23256]
MSNEEFQKLVLQELTSIKGQLNENSRFIEALLHRTAELDAQLHNVSANVDKLCGQVNNPETKVGNLEAKVNNLEAKVGNLETKVDNLEIKVNNLEIKVNALETKVSGLETKFDALQTQVTTIQANMATKEDIAEVNASIMVLNDRLFRQETEITRLKAAK